MLALVLAAMAVTSCGTGAEERAQLDTPSLAAIHELTRAQYRAIDHAASAAVRFGELSRSGRLRSAAKFTAAITRLLGACGRLDGTDALLRELFLACAADARVLVPLIAARGCSSRETCAHAFRSARDRLDGVAPAYARANRAVRATGLHPLCKQALLTPASAYARIRRQRPIFARLARAVESGSRAARASALAAQNRHDRGGLERARRSLRHFRAACR